MADDLTHRGGRDRTRIDVGQPHELRYWSEKFEVSPEELKEAVKAVGTEAREVEAHLKRNKVGDTGTAS